MSIQQHTVIIGGSTGIGFATARQLLALGHKVTITGRTEQRLQAAKTELGGDLTVLVLDAADTGRLADAFAGIGAFDHLVLSLGSGKGAGPFASVSLDEVRQGFEERVSLTLPRHRLRSPRCARTAVSPSSRR